MMSPIPFCQEEEMLECWDGQGGVFRVRGGGLHPGLQSPHLERGTLARIL